MEEIKVIEYTNEYGLKDKWTYKGSRLIKTEMTYPKLNVKQKRKPMSKKQELFEQIEGLFTDFQEQHNGTTKKSQANARKAIGELKKLVTDYRKESVSESK
tara:strand:+ start:2243 stop:2545 length:303 start_codon:yes stop_codon:yes gene_type:complete